MKRIWTGETINYQGKGFSAEGVSALPTPVQRPHPPIWSGGNSERAIRRAVELCDGWSPFPATDMGSAATRTGTLATIAELRTKIEFAKAHAERIGRTAALEICMVPFILGLTRDSRPQSSALTEELNALAEIGVGWVSVSLPCRDRQEYIANAQWFSEEVMLPLSPVAAAAATRFTQYDVFFFAAGLADNAAA